MTTVNLTRVHLQRLQGAVEAALAGARIHFRVNCGEPRTIVWVDERTPTTQHTVMSVWGDPCLPLAVVEEKFREMVCEARS